MDVFYIRSGTSKLAPETVRLLESKLEEVI
jgi:hypothetical protein